MTNTQAVLAEIARHRRIEAKATKVPWETGSHVCAEEVYPKKGAPVYYTDIYHCGRSVNLTGDERNSPGSANSEEAILARNSHETLLAVAEAAVKALAATTSEEIEWTPERTQRCCAAWSDLDAALARLMEGK